MGPVLTFVLRYPPGTKCDTKGASGCRTRNQDTQVHILRRFQYCPLHAPRLQTEKTIFILDSVGMLFGTRDRTSNRTFSISVFDHRTNRPRPIPTKRHFFCGRRKIIFVSTKRHFFWRQVRKRHFFCGWTGSISVGVRFGVPTEPREASSVRCSYRTTVPKRYRKASLGFRKRKIVFQPCFTTRNLCTKLCGIRSQPEERKGLLVKP